MVKKNCYTPNQENVALFVCCKTFGDSLLQDEKAENGDIKFYKNQWYLSPIGKKGYHGTRGNVKSWTNYLL